MAPLKFWQILEVKLLPAFSLMLPSYNFRLQSYSYIEICTRHSNCLQLKKLLSGQYIHHIFGRPNFPILQYEFYLCINMLTVPPASRLTFKYKIAISLTRIIVKRFKSQLPCQPQHQILGGSYLQTQAGQFATHVTTIPIISYKIKFANHYSEHTNKCCLHVQFPCQESNRVGGKLVVLTTLIRCCKEKSHRAKQVCTGSGKQP